MKKFKQRLALVFNFILLSIVYFIGIGFTSIMAKIFGKSFLFNRGKKSSNFTNFQKTHNLESMF